MKRLEDNELVIISDLDQDSDEWLEWRNQGIGSSDVALLMSPEPVFDRTLGTLWKQKVGYERAVQLNNEHIKRGKEKEPIIRDAVNKTLGMQFEPVCLYRKDAPYLRASLDGLDLGADAILEIKAPATKSFQKMLSLWPKIPENYYHQMQYQMLVSDVEYGIFAFENFDEDEEGNRLHPYPYLTLVENNYELQVDIERRCHLFWKAVQTKTPIGWLGDTLKIFHQRPVLIMVCGNDEQEEEFKSRKFELPKLAKNVASGLLFMNTKDITVFREMKDKYPNHDIKVVNLIQSPFGKQHEVTLDTLNDFVRKIL